MISKDKYAHLTFIVQNFHNYMNIFKKLFSSKEKDECNVKKSNSIFQRVIRVLDYDSLKKWKYCHFTFWHSEYTSDPVVIGKIYEHLRTASVIRLYITRDFIEYSAETKKHGFVCGGCHRGQYMFFEFGLCRSGHRFDIYGEDRTDPVIKEFYEWWINLVRPYEQEFNNDYNL